MSNLLSSQNQKPKLDALFQLTAALLQTLLQRQPSSPLQSVLPSEPSITMLVRFYLIQQVRVRCLLFFYWKQLVAWILTGSISNARDASHTSPGRTALT